MNNETVNRNQKIESRNMAKTALSAKVSETTAEVEASGDIIEGSPTSSLSIAPGAGITGDLDASDISFPRLQITQGVGALSENFKKGSIILDGETEISDGTQEVEFTVCRIGKMFEENVDWDSGEIPRIVTKAEALQIGGSFEWGADGQKPDWLPIADALICIKGEDPEVFTYENANGNYTFALWRIKGTAYKRAAVPIFTAAKMYYRDGISTGSFLLTTEKIRAGSNTVHGPKLRRGSKHDPKFVEWLKDFC